LQEVLSAHSTRKTAELPPSPNASALLGWHRSGSRSSRVSSSQARSTAQGEELVAMGECYVGENRGVRPEVALRVWVNLRLQSEE
ncbi:hypothetical protein P7K49_030956, partial [Saguinus oedipus]